MARPPVRICPVCAREYRSAIETCGDCGVTLPPIVDALGEPGLAGEPGPEGLEPPPEGFTWVATSHPAEIHRLTAVLVEAGIDFALTGHRLPPAFSPFEGQGLPTDLELWVPDARRDDAYARLGIEGLDPGAGEDTPCPACGMQAPPGALECPGCGLSRTSPGECPECGGLLVTGDEVCPHCHRGVSPPGCPICAGSLLRDTCPACGWSREA